MEKSKRYGLSIPDKENIQKWVDVLNEQDCLHLGTRRLYSAPYGYSVYGCLCEAYGRHLKANIKLRQAGWENTYFVIRDRGVILSSSLIYPPPEVVMWIGFGNYMEIEVVGNEDSQSRPLSYYAERLKRRQVINLIVNNYLVDA